MVYELDLNSNLVKTTYGIDDLSLNSNFSNDTLRFFAIKYLDRVLVSMVVKANAAINKSTWTTIVSGLPKISWTHPLKVINTINQTRGTVECVYGADGSIVVITNANSNYLAAGDGLVISGVVMI